MQRFSGLAMEEKAKVRSVHMNHTNPLLNPNAQERKAVTEAGFNTADEGEEICL